MPASLTKRTYPDAMSPLDLQETPRPKKRNLGGEVISQSPSLSTAPSLSSTSENLIDEDSIFSHKSSRMSPSKQLAILEDQQEPVIFCDFQMPGVDVPDDVEEIRQDLQFLADGIGILSPNVTWFNPRRWSKMVLIATYRHSPARLRR